MVPYWFYLNFTLFLLFRGWYSLNCVLILSSMLSGSLTNLSITGMGHDLFHKCGYLTYWPEKVMAPHFSTLAWKIPRMEEPGGLQSMGL